MSPRLALLLVLLGIGALVVRFQFFFPGLSSWDMPAHYLMAKQFRDGIWPYFSGWSPDGFGGFPLGYLYPPLFEWLAGGLGRIFPLMFVFKALLGVGILSLPISVFLFVRGLRFTPDATTFSLLLMSSSLLLFDVPLTMGGTLTSTFRGGLVGAVFSLPFYFLYLRSLKQIRQGPAAIAWSSILLAMITLSHAVTALVASMSTLIYALAIDRSSLRTRRGALCWVGHWGLALLLCAGWIVPFFLMRKFSSGVWLPVTSLKLAYPALPGYLPILAVLACGGLGLFLARSTNSFFRSQLRFPAIVFLALMAALTGLACFSAELEGHTGSWFHGYRLVVFAIAFGSLIGGVFLAEIERRWKSKPLIGLVLVGLFVYSSVIAQKQCFVAPPISAELDGLPVKLGERILLNQGVWSSLTREHDSPNLLVPSLQDRGYELLNGTFVESSVVAPFVYSLLRELAPDLYYWPMERAPLSGTGLAAHASQLGVQWFLTTKALEKDQEKQLAIRGRTVLEIPISVPGARLPAEKLYLYELDNPKVEFMRQAPVWVEEFAWKRQLDSHWLADPGAILVQLPRAGEIPSFLPASGSEALTLAKKSATQLSLTVSSPEKRWIWLKYPYFPDWHAYQDGQPIPVYRASPNFMAVFAAGSIEFRFERSRIEKLAHLLSLISLVGCLIILAVRPRFPSNEPSSIPKSTYR